MKDSSRLKGPWAGTIAVLLAACLFATSGTIIKHLIQGYGLPPLTVAAVRITKTIEIVDGPAPSVNEYQTNKRITGLWTKLKKPVF